MAVILHHSFVTYRTYNCVIYSVKRLTEVSAALFHNRIGRSVFLDYLPLLRYMAVHERAAEHAFQQVCASDPESAGIMSRCRHTTHRGGKPLESGHYFAAMGRLQGEFVGEHIRLRAS